MRRTPENKLLWLADSLTPNDIKGLTKKQVRELKEGIKSPKHLIEKYTKQQLSKENLVTNQKELEDVRSVSNKLPQTGIFISPVELQTVLAFGLDSRKTDVSSADKRLPTHPKIKPQSTLDSDSSQHVSLSKVSKFAKSKQCRNEKYPGIENSVYD